MKSVVSSAVVVAALIVLGMTVWAYRGQMSEPVSPGRSAQVGARPSTSSAPSAPSVTEEKISSLPKVASAAQAAPRGARQFPRLPVDTPAATLYARIAGVGPTLSNSGEVAKLAATLNSCWMASTYEKMAAGVAPESDGKRHGAAQALAKAERNGAQEFCADLPADAYDRADEWTAALAAKGDAQSMLNFATKPFWLRDPIRALQDPARLQQYRQSATDYLNTLIDQGYSEALVAMGSIKLNPTWGEPNAGEAWAYMRAAARARGDADLEARLIHSFDTRVPAEGREAAKSLSDLLIGRCCAR